MKDTRRQFHLFKKENQLKDFIVHAPSIDSSAALVVGYEIGACEFCRQVNMTLNLFRLHSHLSKLQLEFVKIQNLDLVELGVLSAPADVAARNACYLDVANYSALFITVMNEEIRR